MTTAMPAEADYYGTPIDALVAGVLEHDVDLDNWVERWHEGEDQAHGPLSAFLGMTEEEYARWAMDPQALDDIVARRRVAIDGDQTGPIRLRFGIDSVSQESSFGNSTLSALGSGHAISVAVTPPKDFPAGNPEVARSMIQAAFRRLVDTGWTVEMQMGPDRDAAR